MLDPEYINENYYAIRFDAEHRDVINWKGKEYEYIKYGKRGYNELAATILRGKMSFPSLVFFDEGFNIIQPIAGYQDSRTLDMIMRYFYGDYHKTTPWQTYAKNYEKKSHDCDTLSFRDIRQQHNTALRKEYSIE